MSDTSTKLTGVVKACVAGLFQGHFLFILKVTIFANDVLDLAAGCVYKDAVEQLVDDDRLFAPRVVVDAQRLVKVKAALRAQLVFARACEHFEVAGARV